MEGRVQIEGVELDPVEELGPTPTGDSRMKTGDFGLCDLNMGYWLAAIDQGWDITGLPIFVKRKSAHWYMVVRNDRGIGGPKDLEGKRIATRSFRSAIVTWCRGLLKNRHGVDTSTFRWLVTDAEDYFPMYDKSANVETVQDGKVSVKDHLQRLLDGEVDAFLGDISDPELFGWVASDARIRRLFPDYMDEDLRLWRDESIFTPVHMMVLSGKLDREDPTLAPHLRRVPALQGAGVLRPAARPRQLLRHLPARVRGGAVQEVGRPVRLRHRGEPADAGLVHRHQPRAGHHGEAVRPGRGVLEERAEHVGRTLDAACK